MLTNLDQDTIDQIHDLQLEYKDEPQPELLIRIPNKTPGVAYVVEHQTAEFTSLCPLNMAQPDFATITIRYVPNQFLVELKSLKFYLVSFRQCTIFHEMVPPTIMQSLVNLLKPKGLEVIGQFTTRGGLHTNVSSSYQEPIVYQKPVVEVKKK